MNLKKPATLQIILAVVTAIIMLVTAWFLKEDKKTSSIVIFILITLWIGISQKIAKK